jgi:uncharacterized iron-regulated membrane protein
VRRVTFNAVVNMVGFAAFAVLTVTGLVELLLLPPGTGGRGHGGVPTLTVFGLGRHDWGDIHNVAGVAMLGIVALHLTLHWRWIKCLPKLLAGAGRNPDAADSCPDAVRTLQR